jgi:hypothetical protein
MISGRPSLKKQLSFGVTLLHTQISRLFCTDTLNWRVPIIDPYTGKNNDVNLPYY